MAMPDEAPALQGSELVDLIRWALSVDLPKSPRVGSHATGRVLVALASHADARRRCWPSQLTLEREVSGMPRRDIRHAIDALRDSGIIRDTARREGRVIVWELAGPPAKRRRDPLAGTPTGHVGGDVGGNVGGNVGGDARHEQNGTEPNPPSRARSTDVERLAALLTAEGAGIDDVDQIISISDADPDTTTSPVGRLLAAPSHRRDCIRKLRAQRTAAKVAARASSPVCDECHAPVTDCDATASKVAPEHACRGAEDRRAAA